MKGVPRFVGRLRYSLNITDGGRYRGKRDGEFAVVDNIGDVGRILIVAKYALHRETDLFHDVGDA